MSFFPPDDPLALFFALAIGHALADFPLQGEYLARQKIRRTADGTSEWLIALGAHSLIHAGAVWCVTGSKLLAFIELILHALIDSSKGRGDFGYLTDQLLHLGCKLGYVMAIYFWLS